ncbi:MAG: DUF6265 family protein [Planctomycetota bacterium]|nr:DUF6265 family protein [Planctomycetota bacterium]
MTRLLVLCCVLSIAFAEDKTTTPKDHLASLSWMAGTWKGPMWGGTFLAYYAAPSDGKMLSYSQLRSGGEMKFYEFEVFSAQDDGVALIPHPRGARAEKFKLKKIEKNRVVFENPKKDFPTRIVYESPEKGRLKITLSAPHLKSDKTQVFDLKRAE